MANGIGVVYDSFDSSTTVTKTYPFDVVSLAIYNWGSAPLTLTSPAGQNVVVPPNFGWDENIIQTKSFTITASGSYHCDVRSRG